MEPSKCKENYQVKTHWPVHVASTIGFISILNREEPFTVYHQKSNDNIHIVIGFLMEYNIHIVPSDFNSRHFRSKMHCKKDNMLTYCFDPTVVASGAADLFKELRKICRLLFTTAPILKALMEYRNSRMVLA